MADFSQVQIGGPTGSSVQPKQPVAEVSGAATGLSFLAGLAGNAASAYNNLEQKEAKSEQDLFIGSFVEEQALVASAVSQEKISSSEGITALRKNFNRYLAQSPGMFDALADAQKKITTTTGLGKVVAEGTEEEQAFIAFERSAVADGWVNPSMSAEEREEAVTAYRGFKLESDKINAEQQQLALDTARINNSTASSNQRIAKLNMLEKEKKLKGQRGIGSIADYVNFDFRSKMNQIIREYEQNPEGGKEALLQIEGAWSSLQSHVSTVGAGAGREYIDSIVKPISNIYESTKELVKGNLDKTIYENKVATQVGLQKLMILGDEKTARTVAITQMFPNADTVLLPKINSLVIDAVERNREDTSNGDNNVLGKKVADLLSSDSEEKKSIRTYLGIMKSVMSKETLEGEGAEQESSNNVINILKGVDAYSSSTQSPKEYNEVLDFIASPEFGAWSKKNSIPSEVSSQALSVLQQQYSQVVVPKLVEEYENATVVVGSDFSKPGTPGVKIEEAHTFIEPKFSGGGVHFELTKYSTNSAVKDRVRELNKKVSPVLNRLIRMSAHLNGSDYEKVYKDNFVAIFGEELPSEEE